MKVLILTVTAGHGHHATGEAVSDMLEDRGITVQTVDVYDYINRLVHDTIAKGYLFSTKYTPEIYRFFYMLIENKDKDAFFFNKLNVIDLINALGAFKFEKFITDFDPDMIVCTHIFSAKLANEMKRRDLVMAPCVGIITDYTIHPFWEDPQEIEYIVTASPLINHLALKRGIHKNKILPFGIPIHPKFSIEIDKKTARDELGIGDMSTILIMGGSMGYSDNEEIIEQILKLDREHQILAVCGNNKKQFEKLSKLKNTANLENLHVYGFVHNVDIMMSASDCIITKPGGLTVSEALSKELPMVLINPIPGQEERNVDFLLNNGIALLVTKTFSLSEALYHLFENENRIPHIRASIKDIYNKHATATLCDFIESHADKA